MSNDGKRRRNGYLYTPFGGGDALKSALGENMARIANNKQPMGLIAPSHQAADRLAHLRQTTLNHWQGQISHSEQTLGGLGQRKRLADADFLAAIRASVDAHGATAQSTRDARHDARDMHQVDKTLIGGDKVIHEANLSHLKPRHQALSQTRVMNTSPGIYPDLFPDPPLGFLRPDTRYSKGDKLYVLGHGAPGNGNLFARSDGQGGQLSAMGLASHLRDAGLQSNAMDVRLTACQGVPALDEHQYTDGPSTRNSGYLVPEVAKAFHGLGFRDLTVTGYQGNGVTFPFNSPHHLRSDPADDTNRFKRSLAAIRYRVSEMGE